MCLRFLLLLPVLLYAMFSESFLESGSLLLQLLPVEVKLFCASNRLMARAS